MSIEVPRAEDGEASPKLAAPEPPDLSLCALDVLSGDM